MMTTRIRLLAVAALALLPLAPRVARAQVPTPRMEPRDDDEPWEAQGSALRRFEYFYEQRAYPFTTIPTRPTRREMRAMRLPGALGGARFNTLPNSASGWTSLGPRPIGTSPANTGRVSAIAVDPGNSSVVYVGGAQGGVWKSTDAGMTWTPLLDQQCSLAVGSIAIDPVNTNIIYVGTGEANFSGDSYYGCGVLRSSDGGATWTQLGAATFDNSSGGAVISRLWIDPRTAGNTSSATLLAATSYGVYRSADAGASWSQVLSVGYGYATDLVADPVSSDVLYAAGTSAWGNADNGVYKSVDNGVTWARLAGFPSNSKTTGRIALAVSPAAPGSVWAAVADASTGNMQGMYRTSDGGTNWSTLGALPSDMVCNGQCWYDITIAVDPVSPSVVYVGTLYVMKSMDGGRTFMNTNGAMHVDQHAIVIDQRNPGTVYAGNDGGIFVSQGGSTWSTLNANLALTQFYPGFSLLASSGNFDLLGGAQDNGTLEYVGSNSWNPVFGGDGGFTAIDSTVAGRAYAETQWVAGSGYSGPRRRDPGNPNFPLKMTGIDASQSGLFIPPLVMHPRHPAIMYFGLTTLYRSFDSAENWTAISPVLGGRISAVGPAPSDSNTVYAGTSSGVLAVTHDGGQTWANGAGLPTRYVTDVVVHRSNPRIAYATVSGFGTPHVFRTGDGGASWANITGDLPNVPVNALVLLPGGELDVGTDIGVFRSADGGATWTPFTGGLPNVAVLDLVFDAPSGTLVAATHGRGVWKSTIQVVAPPALLAVDSEPPAPPVGGRLGRFVVSVRESAGSLVPTASNAITVRLGSGTGTLNGRTTVSAVNGVAAFDSLQITGSGPFTLVFESSGLASAQSDTFNLTPTDAVQLSRNGGRAMLIAGGSETRTDSVSVYVSGSGASTTAWSAGNTASWSTITVPTGTGSGVLRWSRSATSLAAGTYVDTISVTLASGGTPAKLLDTLVVLAAPSVRAEFLPDTIAGSSATPAVADIVIDPGSGSSLAVGTFAATLTWDSTLVRLDSAGVGDLGKPVLSAATAGSVRISATNTSGAAGSVRPARLYWSFLLPASGSPAASALRLSSLSLRSTAASGALDLAPWTTVRDGLALYEAVLRGDVDGDGQVTAADATLILNGSVGLALPAGSRLRPNGDANCDGIVDAADAQVVLAFVAGKPIGNACVGTVR